MPRNSWGAEIALFQIVVAMLSLIQMSNLSPLARQWALFPLVGRIDIRWKDLSFRLL